MTQIAPLLARIASLLLVFAIYFSDHAVKAIDDELPHSTGRIIKITDHGLKPHMIEVKKEERFIFFVNDSSESLITLELTFGKNTAHCSSDNLQLGEDGVIRSIKPIAPKDFASACFHEAGVYPFIAYGAGGSSKGVKGKIVVK